MSDEGMLWVQTVPDAGMPHPAAGVAWGCYRTG